MTDIKQKALALVNEAAKGVIYYELDDLDDLERVYFTEALCRAIQQHEAFRQEVSFALETFKHGNTRILHSYLLDPFIIAKPDPLVEVFAEIGAMEPKGIADKLRAAIEKRGGKITWGEKQ